MPVLDWARAQTGVNVLSAVRRRDETGALINIGFTLMDRGENCKKIKIKMEMGGVKTPWRRRWGGGGGGEEERGGGSGEGGGGGGGGGCGGGGGEG